MKYNKLLGAIIFFLVTIGISIYIPDLIFGDSTNSNALFLYVVVPVQEQGTIYNLGIHLSTFFEFLLQAIFLPLSFYMIYFEITKYKSNQEENSRFNKFMKIILWGSLLTLMVGIGIHYTGDAIDTQLALNPEQIDGTAATFPKLIAYFFDEVLGHKIYYAGMMIFLTSLTVYQIWHKNDKDRAIESNLTLITFPILGAIYGIAQGIAFMEGQSAFEYLIICFIQLIIILIYFFIIQKFSFDEFRLYPYIAFFIAMNVGVIVILMIKIPSMSFIYPFFPQKFF